MWGFVVASFKEYAAVFWHCIKIREEIYQSMSSAATVLQSARFFSLNSYHRYKPAANRK